MPRQRQLVGRAGIALMCLGSLGCTQVTIEVLCSYGDTGLLPDTTSESSVAVSEEICDGIDNDGDGQVDEGFDGDGDGWASCLDCDDEEAQVYPGGTEICDGLDNDCSGSADESWDDDGDGMSECGTDCDDSDPTVSGHLSESCDGIDNDCDDEVDEGFDLDNDGVSTCEGDCDDNEPLRYPGAEEICDGLDNDCNGEVEDELDLDGDDSTICDGDCDDSDPSIGPQATETCDGVDNNCDGSIDESGDCSDCITSENYLICDMPARWDQAQQDCQAQGASLVIIGEDEENQNVGSLAQTYLGAPTWIGLQGDNDKEGWTWVDGSASSYSAWGKGEPLALGSDICVLINAPDVDAWSTSACTLAYPYICKL